ncbi:site-determining protein [Ferrigenium kumadai]|uniref:Site-determining protein n=1 Tax=Ferrigenium kumadai TaxID=1682490 RepID=A0AAN1VYZ7_9PROT|nr:P-loop NTPase [Ferrigenium kumadai]BBI98749.1 site-determining protein [Ferrigenium kumadai]
MRSEIGIDQAEGLRRLLLRNQTQVITVVAGKSGIGRTSVTINLASALARSGKDVLVLDENHAPDNLLDRLGLFAGHDLLDVAQGKCHPKQALLKTRGFGVVPAARAMHELACLSRDEQQRLEDALTGLSNGVDVMLVDAAMPSLSRAEGLAGRTAVSSSLANGAALLVVVDATASGITESYALIKRLALENARMRFEIVVNKVADEQAALTVFENMAKVARRNLAVCLEYLGCIPQDERLMRATQLGRPVVEAFPTAVSARACLTMSEKLLRLPVQQDEAETGVRAIIQSLVRQVAQPLQRHSREMAHVVN